MKLRTNLQSSLFTVAIITTDFDDTDDDDDEPADETAHVDEDADDDEDAADDEEAPTTLLLNLLADACLCWLNQLRIELTCLLLRRFEPDDDRAAADDNGFLPLKWRPICQLYGLDLDLDCT